MADWMLRQPGMDDVRSINPVVGETNDGGLNDIRARPIAAEDVWRALGKAHAGPVEEGSVGAGTGTQAFGWKGGIGTSSRVLPAALGGWTVGVLVQTNYRSEEHTSELQSLMRISYAGFCLKKKNTTHINN